MENVRCTLLLNFPVLLLFFFCLVRHFKFKQKDKVLLPFHSNLFLSVWIFSKLSIFCVRFAFPAICINVVAAQYQKHTTEKKNGKSFIENLSILWFFPHTHSQSIFLYGGAFAVYLIRLYTPNRFIDDGFANITFHQQKKITIKLF